MIDATYWWNQELPGFDVPWLDGDGTVIDYSNPSDWTLMVQLVREHEVVAEQTDYITGYDTIPNVDIERWSDDLLAAVQADMEADGVRSRFYDLAIIATRTADNADAIWRSGNLPVVLFTEPAT